MQSVRLDHRGKLGLCDLETYLNNLYCRRDMGAFNLCFPQLRRPPPVWSTAMSFYITKTLGILRCYIGYRLSSSKHTTFVRLSSSSFPLLAQNVLLARVNEVNKLVIVST